MENYLLKRETWQSSPSGKAVPDWKLPVSGDRDNVLVFRRPRNYTDNRKRSHEKVAVLREHRKCSLNSRFKSNM